MRAFSKVYHNTFQAVAWIAGVTTFVMAILWIATFIQLQTSPPLQNPALQKLLTRYSQNPQDISLREPIRELDFLARRAFFTTQKQLQMGGYIFAGSLAIFLVALRLLSIRRLDDVQQTADSMATQPNSLSTQKAQPPNNTVSPSPTEDAAQDELNRVWQRRAVATVFTCVMLIGLGSGYSTYFEWQSWGNNAQEAVLPPVTPTPQTQLAQPLITEPKQLNPPTPAQPTQTVSPVTAQPNVTTQPAEPTPPVATQPTEPMSNVTAQPTEPTRPVPAQPTEPTQPSMPNISATNWPGFRGIHGQGIAEGNPPLEWDAASKKNIRWKTKIPKTGFNSPIVWGNYIFASGADAQAKEIYAWNADTGELLWTHIVDQIPDSPTKLPKVSQDTGWAAPTMVTDGGRVYAIFATGDLLAVNFQGQRIWGRNLGVPSNHYGHSSSLILWQDFLLVQYDHDEEAKILALQKTTGEIAWQQSREVQISWASPMLLTQSLSSTSATSTYSSISSEEASSTFPLPQLILSTNPKVVSYDPNTGNVLWEQECMAGEVAPSPATNGKAVFVTNVGIALLALNPADGAILWEINEYEFPEVSSPVAYGDFVIVAHSHGGIMAFDAADGKLFWQQEYRQGFYASPIICQNHIYLTDKTGLTYIIALEKDYRLLAQNSLNEPVVATPAFVGQRIYFRTKDHLICIENE